MISVNVGELNNHILELNRIIDDYNLTYLNLFNSINQLSDSWVGDMATNFFSSMEKEKNETLEIINRIKKEKEIYKYIYDSYKTLGKKIKCNLDAKEIIVTKIDNCIDKTKEINMIYQSIDVTKNYDERDSIVKKKQDMIKVLDIFNKIKNNIKTTYSKIEEIEREVSRKLDNIEYIKVNEFEIN